MVQSWEDDSVIDLTNGPAPTAPEVTPIPFTKRARTTLPAAKETP